MDRFRWGLRKVRVIEGRGERSENVASAFACLRQEVEWVLVHDAARPFLTAQLARRVLRAARETGASASALPVADTVKKFPSKGKPVLVDRTSLHIVQTPQVFRAEMLREIYTRCGARDLRKMPDETTLAERFGARVRYVTGDHQNIKITTAEDLESARRKIRIFLAKKP